MGRPRLDRKADCHPDRPHEAKGLCGSCYVGMRRKATPENRAKHREYARDWRQRNPEKFAEQQKRRKQKAGYPDKRLAYMRKWKYGVEPEEVNRLLSLRSGLCHICGSQPATHLDHNHSTGKVRGMLCSGCNTGIGLLRDDLSIVLSAAAYLQGDGLG